jgi:hypothetical protein
MRRNGSQYRGGEDRWCAELTGDPHITRNLIARTALQDTVLFTGVLHPFARLPTCPAADSRWGAL